jgi:alpha-L-fucosidase
MSVERAARFEKLVRSLQPDCLISGRLGGESQSDYDSEGDNAIPNLSRAGAWETPATLNSSWGFKKNDHNWKKPETLIFKLADIVSKGGNYLLNVGPDGEGVIPQPSQDMLLAVGRWLRTNGESIYGAGRTPFGPEFGAYNATEKDRRGRPLFQARAEWRCTTKPGKLYLHLFKWPAGSFTLDGVQGRATRAYLLADTRRTPLKLSQAAGRVSIALPQSAPDPIDSVVCLELAGTSSPAR